VAQGVRAYTNFCAGCHGAEAQGTALAPALPGHSESVVKRQVRSPIGTMPPFSSSIISDEDLDQIAGFIASLPASGKHVEPVDMEGALAMHHWMALSALEEGDTQDAVHHIGHILAMVTDHEHELQMEEAKEAIAQGELHDAEHEIEEMLAGQADAGLLYTEMHLRLTLASVVLQDAPDAMHHMEHFMAVAGEAAAGQAREILELLGEGELHDAEHEIEEMLEPY
jgi:hypothetical protein